MIHPEGWQRIDDVFQAAMDLDPGQRATFLDSACNGDPILREKVEAMLASDDRGWELIEKSAFEVAAPLLSDEPPQLADDQTFSHYKIVTLIGKGGMGEVYLAKDEKLKRSIALKLLPVDYTSDKDRLRRFQQEAQAASALNHPNILTIHELGEVDGQQFIATEFVDGETLRQRLQHGPLTLSETSEIVIQIASALTAAHRAGIVHRDIKPENIMLRPDGYVKVLDFGLAKLTEQQEQSSKAGPADNPDISSHLMMGTIRYMSPEQARGIPVDGRSDIFSLGVVLYEIVAGCLPFDGKTTNDQITAILNTEPAQINAPDKLQRIINKALRKNKDERYQSVEELLIDLRNLMQASKIEFRPLSSGQPGPSRGTITRGSILTTELEPIATFPSVEYLINEFKQNKVGASLGLLALTIAAVGISFGIYKVVKLRRTDLPFQNITVTKFTNSSDGGRPSISPDGKYVVYTKRSGTEGAVWLRALGTANELQIVPPTEGVYSATFSPDGKNLFYTAQLTNEPPATFMKPISGGEAIKLPLSTPGNVSVSPDGKHLAFLRSTSEGKTSIVIANADGTDEWEIVSRQAPNYYWPGIRPTWSSEGKQIACVGQNGTEGFPRVFEIDVETRTERPITAQKWTSMSGVVWLPDRTGLLVVAAEETSSIQQIWHVSYPTGEARRVTNDAVNYTGLDLTADGKTLVTARVEAPTSIWVHPIKSTPSNPAGNDVLSVVSNAKQLNINVTGNAYFQSNFARLSWTPDGRIVYMSEESGNADIWSMNSDGSDRKQLTTDPHWDAAAIVSSDGRYVAFMSNRAGGENIWLMDINGANQRQLTHKLIARVPDFSADGKWVFFDSWDTGKETTWKVPFDGGEPIQVFADLSDLQAVSPDGRLLAYIGLSSSSILNSERLYIVPAEGGPPIKSFDALGYEYQWSPTGQSMSFRFDRNGVTNLWEQPFNGSEPRQLSFFTSEGVLTYAWSRDGKQLAVARNQLNSDVVLIRDIR